MTTFRKFVGLTLLALQATCTALIIYYLALTFDDSKRVSNPGMVFNFKPGATTGLVNIVFQLPLLVIGSVLGFGAAMVAGYHRFA